MSQEIRIRIGSVVFFESEYQAGVGVITDVTSKMFDANRAGSVGIRVVQSFNRFDGEEMEPGNGVFTDAEAVKVVCEF
ncbi:MAG: hypothetical protein KDK08_29815 [Rhizobiaceae bacterium]|nr:hypothetical protein [Rhizobiaceae bacterium]